MAIGINVTSELNREKPGTNAQLSCDPRHRSSKLGTAKANTTSSNLFPLQRLTSASMTMNGLLGSPVAHAKKLSTALASIKGSKARHSRNRDKRGDKDPTDSCFSIH